MLYDPKWKQETRADAFSLSTLIEWLEKQPPLERYCYLNHGGCMFAQYFTNCGFKNVDVGGMSFDHGEPGKTVCQMFPNGWDDIAADDPATFGSALRRARVLSNSKGERNERHL